MFFTLRNAVVCLFLSVSLNPLFAQTPTPYPNFLLDHHQDGVIDSKDLLILIESWGVEGIATPTPSPTASPTVPSSITVNVADPIPMKLVHIPAGSYMMGSPANERSRDPDEGPVHLVTIDYDFFMGETEVTQKQWRTVMGTNPAQNFGVGDEYPVYGVSWDDCQAFLAALNELGQGTFRLPSEAEWEYACRAGTTTRFYFGDSLGCEDGCMNCGTDKGVIFVPNRIDYMWFCVDGSGSQAVRQRLPNGFGLYDISGNVWEWCQDIYQDSYEGAPSDGSAWQAPSSSSDRVVRGGTWSLGAEYSRSSSRDLLRSDVGHFNVGFRVVREP